MLSTLVALVFFTAGTVVLASGIFTLYNNHKAITNKLVFLLTLALTIWSFGMAMSNVAADAATSEAFRRIASIGWGTVYAILLHFILVITGKSISSKKWWFYLCLYLPALLSIVAFAVPNGINPHPYDIQQTKYGWINVPRNNIWDWLFYAYYIGYTLLGLILLYRWGKESSDSIIKKKSRIIILSLLSGVVLGTITDIVLNSLYSELPQMAPVVMLIPTLAIYHVLQKDSLDISESIDKKTSYIILFSIVLTYTVLSTIQVSLSNNSVVIVSAVFDASVIRGIIVQIQLFLSIYLVLKENRPGYILSVILNVISLLGAIVFFVRYKSTASLPGVVSCAGVLVIITLIKAYREKNVTYIKRIKYNSEHVLLTGLHNRGVLEKTLASDSLLPSSNKRALLCINLFAMHALSVRYGYYYNQTMLKNITDSLKAFCNDNYLLFDTNEYRFIFYVKDYEDERELTAFCEKISETLSSYLYVHGIKYVIGILQIDISTVHNTQELLKKVTDTSEMAANNNSNILFHSPQLDIQISRENEISQEIREIAEGIRTDRLYLQYQPIFDITSNKVCGFEALARLNSEKHSLVSPLEFIPIAEKTNMIAPFGEIIIIQALHFLSKLKENGHDRVSVSINISTIQMMEGGFADGLLSMIREKRINPENVGIELTESVFATERAEMNTVINTLKATGVKILIDDFGTGYSSFARERDLDIDCLKIDKSFIDKLMELNPEEALTEEIISMAHKLGHCVVAEGVEYDRQLSYLRSHGCDMIQGYLISRPMDEEMALAFLLKDINVIKDEGEIV